MIISKTVPIFDEAFTFGGEGDRERDKNTSLDATGACGNTGNFGATGSAPHTAAPLGPYWLFQPESSKLAGAITAGSRALQQYTWYTQPVL